MALKYWAYIFLSPGFDPTQHIAELTSTECRFKTIGISEVINYKISGRQRYLWTRSATTFTRYFNQIT